MPKITNPSVKDSILIQEWHPTKNTLDPAKVTCGSSRKAWWLCSSCNRSWEAAIGSRYCLGAKCPYCSGKVATEDNCLLAIYPEITSEWHPTKNDCKPSEVTPHSGKKAWWLCKYGHEWILRIATRTNKGGRSCPYCIGRRVHIGNCLATKCPELIAEWHVEKNGTKTPHNTFYSGHKKVWWVCRECKHEWQATPNLKTSRLATGCPKCRRPDSKKQKLLFSIIKDIFPNTKILYNYKHPYLRFTKTNARMELDIYLPEQAIAFEYQGEMHFFPRYGQKALDSCKQRDAEKRETCQNSGINLIEVLYTWGGDKESICNMLGIE